MSTPQHPGGPNNNQQNHFGPHSTGYVNQGGNQINTTNNTYYSARKARNWTGWTVLVFLALDVAFFFYGSAAYTGRPDSAGDMWRAGISLFLLAITGSLVRRWFRGR
ncbi:MULTISPECIES: hypothetical protein [unclassified Amycolatopsis]|uniref:hypothetical protein n=1 Tax=unclassified Amycolatopsis TaxID=2618356 RepID=UPI0028740D49|nr:MULTISPECIES: hypothetical protein [unclassified Amycolatopsis]MDS0132732.1 hypothetical protein [Amycolatopsis sp. 505]MDS0142443.1 hypothetical protein [Amycolatopsis sp. CM201R]